MRLARRGLDVVRLKGGDPFLFGRGGEEALALVEAGVPFEVVPGVSSLAAVPAAAGIPVTHRGRLLAGDDRERPRAARLRCAGARPRGRSSSFMGLARLEELAAGLIAHGRPGSTPAAVIASGTLPEQRVVVAPLDRIARRCSRPRPAGAGRDRRRRGTRTALVRAGRAASQPEIRSHRAPGAPLERSSEIRLRRVTALPPYAFAEVERVKLELRRAGEDVIDLGFGNPDVPSPDVAVEKLAEAAQDPRNHRYSASRGIPNLRRAICDLYRRRFGVELDPEREAITTIGAKEGLSHLMWLLVEPGDVALVPDPSYPIHRFAPVLAGAEVEGFRLDGDLGAGLEEAHRRASGRARTRGRLLPAQPDRRRCDARADAARSSTSLASATSSSSTTSPTPTSPTTATSRRRSSRPRAPARWRSSSTR